MSMFPNKMVIKVSCNCGSCQSHNIFCFLENIPDMCWLLQPYIIFFQHKLGETKNARITAMSGNIPGYVNFVFIFMYMYCFIPVFVHLYIYLYNKQIYIFFHVALFLYIHSRSFHCHSVPSHPIPNKLMLKKQMEKKESEIE